MKQPKRPALTADAFFAWAMQQTDGRYELDSGTIVAMSPERASHAIAKGNVYVALRAAIAAGALACQAFPDGMSVRIDDDTVYEPDALVRCGRDLPGDALEANDPLILVEIVSPSSRGVDRGIKLAGYFRLPGLRHYLIVDIEKRIVIHNFRGDDGRVEVRFVGSGPLQLDPPGLALDVRDIFAGV